MTVEALTADGYKILTVSAAGPASAVTVSAGGAANVDLSVGAHEASRILSILGLKSVSGLPDGAVLQSVSFPNLSTVRLRVFNPTTSDITVSADSVSAEILVKAV